MLQRCHDPANEHLFRARRLLRPILVTNSRTGQGVEPSDCVRPLEIAAAPARVLEGVDRERTVLILVRLVPAHLNKGQRQ